MGNEKYNSSPLEDAEGESPAQLYEIRVKGCIDQVFWADWFGGMEISMDTDQEETTLRGRLSDQAEMYGLLSRLRNKGLSLVSVQQIHNDNDTKAQ